MTTQLITNAEYLPALLPLLSSAKKSIDILAFSFAIGSAGGKLNEGSAPYKIAQHLAQLKARNRKLKIRLYIEGERETADRNAITARFLQREGIEVRYGATHAKGFSIDGKHVLFGSTNLTSQSMTRNFEANLLLHDAATARGFTAYFDHLWRGGRHGGIQLPPPLYADHHFLPLLLGLIDTAKKSLHFSIYFFEQEDIEEALLRAHDRGVKITGLLHNHAAFAMSYVRRTRRTAKRLLRSGLTDLHYGPTTLFAHSKWLVRDRHTLALGTGNWLDEDVEIHPQLYVKLDDAAIARQLLAILKTQIRAQGTPVAEFREPAWKKWPAA